MRPALAALTKDEDRLLIPVCPSINETITGVVNTSTVNMMFWDNKNATLSVSAALAVTDIIKKRRSGGMVGHNNTWISDVNQFDSERPDPTMPPTTMKGPNIFRIAAKTPLSVEINSKLMMIKK